MFSITQHKGFTLTFANDYQVSVQFGAGNYCDRRYDGFFEAAGVDRWASMDAEVALFRPDGSFVRLTQHDTVKGYATPDEVAKIIAIAATDPESLAVKHTEPEGWTLIEA